MRTEQTTDAKPTAVPMHAEFIAHFPSATVSTFRNDVATLGGQKMCRSCGRPHAEGTNVITVREPHDHMTFYYCIGCAGRSDAQRLSQFAQWGERIDEKRKQEVKDNGGKCLRCSKRKPRRGHFWCSKCLGA